MTLKVNIANGGSFGGGRLAVVDEDNHLAVAQYEPKLHLDGKPSKFRFFSQYLGSAGVIAEAIPNGNADMGVNGGTTPVEFFHRLRSGL